ncbi:hypothetical protein [Nocardiopsis alkaliphila]|uniref:hypothetical protein n=1 Tax=Nocardiopsis alkaliphila TaxID=225762 RepID=UPI0003477D10|nr:hypothetical protein [Nocardiopsis alkaliphila]
MSESAGNGGRFPSSTGLFLARVVGERQRPPDRVCAAHGRDRMFVHRRARH